MQKMDTAIVAWWCLRNTGAPVALVLAGFSWLVVAVSLYVLFSRVSRRESS
jgi:hypothetical protein